MINTVLGSIKPSELGVTLCHEHIMWNPNGLDTTVSYNRDKIITKMLPYLNELKELGCNTLLDGTPHGSGRDILLLQKCSKKSGLNIVTCTGAWDGVDTGWYVPEALRVKTIAEIAEIWIAEFFGGIAETGIKSGFVKIALGGEGKITDLQERLLRAAAITSNKTNLPLQCHILSSKVALEVVKIVEEESLPLNKLIWLHADTDKDYPVIRKLIQKGVWVEYDYSLSVAEDFSWYTETIKRMLKDNLIDNLLISQDAGIYIVGQKNDADSIRPYSRVFKEFVPYCFKHGISQEVINKIFITNPAKVLDMC